MIDFAVASSAASQTAFFNSAFRRFAVSSSSFRRFAFRRFAVSRCDVSAFVELKKKDSISTVKEVAPEVQRHQGFKVSRFQEREARAP